MLYLKIKHDSRVGRSRVNHKGDTVLHERKNLEFLKGKSANFMILNKVTKNKYIGKSNNLLNRILSFFNQDFIKGKNSMIYKALLKFGHGKFTFILKFCEQQNLERCAAKRKQFYIDKIKPRYNIRRSVYKDKTQ